MLNFDSELIVLKYLTIRFHFGCYPLLFFFLRKEEAVGEPVAVGIFGISAVLHFRLATDYTSSLVPLDA
jgi:hypothetical protein